MWVLKNLGASVRQNQQKIKNIFNFIYIYIYMYGINRRLYMSL